MSEQMICKFAGKCECKTATTVPMCDSEIDCQWKYNPYSEPQQLREQFDEIMSLMYKSTYSSEVITWGECLTRLESAVMAWHNTQLPAIRAEAVKQFAESTHTCILVSSFEGDGSVSKAFMHDTNKCLACAHIRAMGEKE